MRKGASPKPKPASKPRHVTARLKLGADCTLREATELKSRLADTVSGTSRVIIDGGAVRRIDAAGLQLLTAFVLREVAAGRQVEWRAASGELRQAAATLGLLQVLALDAPGGAASS
jgi:anti-anti-sigma regulatory factor